MTNRCSEAVDPAPCAPLELLRLWTVDEGVRYDIRRSPQGSERLIVLRTHAGRGRLWTVGGGPLELAAGSLLLVDLSTIDRYRCAGVRWAFWWCECAPVPLPLPRGMVLDIPLGADEPALFAEMALRLRGHPDADPAVASATLAWLLHRWTASGRKQEAGGPDRAVEELVHRIHAAVDAGRPPLMRALTAGIPYGERRLRDLFKAATGRSPKRYLDDLRLQRVEALLGQGATVAATAASLGYSSPFHLSRVYKARFGRAPSVRG